ncbi:iron ABC transporter permease [Nocardioides sp. BP30]|uniref:FecCD family ABC transporter permease n=1 Tax=Nocardioides sp. BP30 TaxID=3036374 RepID=UPI0024699A31|nr:iron ABC transporter permease [Nocardioides sp. BP30]WGL52313.1 iron ABC transporter permease [Nocardioides sp. BP30]
MIGILGVLAVAVASVMIGSRMVGPAGLFDAHAPGHAILEARLPRTALALLVGAALGVAGGCLQGLTRNPLADPGLLGVNAGASFAMVLAIGYVGVSSLHTYLWFAFVGAAVAALLVHGLASLGRDGATPGKLVLVGAAVTAGLTSWTSGVLLLQHHTMDVYRRWEVGTVGGRDWSAVAAGAPFLAVGAILALAGSRTLDALALGDDLARGLGRRVALDRLVIGAAIVLLAGTATALAGPVGFVGLLAPHLVRATGTAAYTRVLPLAALYGAVLVTVADVVGRVILPPTEVQVGIMTAVVGVPVFCWFLRRGRLGAV